MSSIHVPHLYDKIISNTIDKMRSEFENSGIPTSVLVELNAKWRTKLHQPNQTQRNLTPPSDDEEDEYADHANNYYNGFQVDGDLHLPYVANIAPTPPPMQSNNELPSETSSDEDEMINDKILCQFEKVSRTKNRWKTNFKDGKDN
eukprot:NODE_331_length_9425_cov_0.815355.p5 type:complete len:146 gc:universal NODE_331_length_9425_cov_0.815355:1660-2097(+)